MPHTDILRNDLDHRARLLGLTSDNGSLPGLDYRTALALETEVAVYSAKQQYGNIKSKAFKRVENEELMNVTVPSLSFTKFSNNLQTINMRLLSLILHILHTVISVTKRQMILPPLFLFLAGISSQMIGVFDAGSTGTRLSLYSIDHGRVTHRITARIEGGMHVIPLNSIVPTLQRLLKQTGVGQTTPLWFEGTAGLRSLTGQQQYERLYFVKMGLAGYNVQQIEVIKGYEEAMYTLKAFEYVASLIPFALIIDMGGMSTQIIRKKGKIINLDSYNFGMVDSNCLRNKQANTVVGMMDGSGWLSPQDITGTIRPAAGQPTNSLYNCILSVFNRQGMIKPIKAPNEKPLIYLMSYFSNLYQDLGGQFSLGQMKADFQKECPGQWNHLCNMKFLSIKILERLGFVNNDDFNLLDKVDGLDITWALGIAVEISRGHMGSKMQQGAKAITP